MLRVKWLVLIMTVAVAACACGGDTSETPGDSPLGAIGDITDGSSAEDGGSGNSSVQMSENVTIPLPDGGTLTASQTDTGYGYAYVEYPADRYDGLVEFYNDWITTDSRNWNGNDSGFGWVWNSDSSRFGVKECVAGGSGDTLNAVCVEISEWAE